MTAEQFDSIAARNVKNLPRPIWRLFLPDRAGQQIISR